MSYPVLLGSYESPPRFDTSPFPPQAARANPSDVSVNDFFLWDAPNSFFSFFEVCIIAPT